jgi:hypothetical protein
MDYLAAGDRRLGAVQSDAVCGDATKHLSLGGRRASTLEPRHTWSSDLLREKL